MILARRRCLGWRLDGSLNEAIMLAPVVWDGTFVPDMTRYRGWGIPRHRRVSVGKP